MSYVYGYKYLSQQVLEGFNNYKYSCIDTSPLSNYVSHPFWNQVVKLFPLWVAPNVMTLGGFAMVMSGYFVMTAADYDLTAAEQQGVPNFLWLYCAVCTFMAHVLDGIDGKQARRTGTSGPTGELFDHGLDSWSTLPFTVTLFTAFGRAEFSVPPVRLLCILISVQTVFIVTHWEKYNTGVLFLSWGYDVSQYGLALFYLATYFVGYNYWRFYVMPGVTFAVVLEAGFYLTCIVSVIVSIYNMYLSYYVAETGLQPNVFEGARPMVPFLVLSFICIVWGQNTDVINQDPRAFIWLNGTLFSNIACRLIIAQMSKTQAAVWNWLLCPVGAAAAVGSLLRPAGVWQLYVLYGLVAFVTASHIHYGVCVVNQLCAHFGIRPFSISGHAAKPPKSDYSQAATVEQAALLSNSDQDNSDDGEDEIYSAAAAGARPTVSDSLQASVAIPNAYAL